MPQVGDKVVYLRCGHETSVQRFPDRKELPLPPFQLHPSLPHAVACEVTEVAYVLQSKSERAMAEEVAASSGDHVIDAVAQDLPQNRTRIHVRLKVRAGLPPHAAAQQAASGAAAAGGAPGGAEADDASVADAAAASNSAAPAGGGALVPTEAEAAVPVGEEWDVTVLPPAAGVSDYLILHDRYEWASRQWELCMDALAAEEGAKLAVKSDYLVDTSGWGKYEPYEGYVVGLRRDAPDLIESLWVRWAGDRDDDEEEGEGEGGGAAALSAAAHGDGEPAAEPSAAAAAAEAPPTSESTAEGGGATAAKPSPHIGSYGKGSGDPLSPWEVEVHGAREWRPEPMPERLSVVITQSLSRVIQTEAVALLEDPAAIAASAAAAASSASSSALAAAGSTTASGSGSALTAASAVASTPGAATSSASHATAAAAAAEARAAAAAAGPAGPAADEGASVAAGNNPSAEGGGDAMACAPPMLSSSSLLAEPQGVLTRREMQRHVSERPEPSPVPLTLALVLRRLQRGYYRQWAAVPHDLRLVLARHNGTSRALLAQQVAPLLLAAASEEAEVRRSWQQLHEAAVASGELARAMELARPPPPPPPKGGKARMRVSPADAASSNGGGGEESAEESADGGGVGDRGAARPRAKERSQGFRIRIPRPPGCSHRCWGGTICTCTYGDGEDEAVGENAVGTDATGGGTGFVEVEFEAISCDLCGADCSSESFMYVPSGRRGRSASAESMDLCPACFAVDAAGACRYAGAERQCGGALAAAAADTAAAAAPSSVPATASASPSGAATAGRGAAPSAPGAELVGATIEVFWDGDQAWFRAEVLRYLPRTRQHEVRYVEDGEVHVEDLSRGETWRRCPELKMTLKLPAQGSDDSMSGSAGAAANGSPAGCAACAGKHRPHTCGKAGGGGGDGGDGGGGSSGPPLPSSDAQDGDLPRASKRRR